MPDSLWLVYLEWKGDWLPRGASMRRVMVKARSEEDVRKRLSQNSETVLPHLWDVYSITYMMDEPDDYIL